MELFGEALLRDDNYEELLRYIASSPDGLCTMNDLKEQFARRTKGSMLYYMTERLEKAKLLRIRSDGRRNFLELTPRAEETLEVTR